MTLQKYLNDYNYHDWSKFMVKSPKDKPTGPHFAAVLFEKENRSEYDSYSGNHGSYSYDVIHYFCFPDQETLSEWVLRAAKDNKNFFFFEVKKLGEAELKVSVDVGV